MKQAVLGVAGHGGGGHSLRLHRSLPSQAPHLVNNKEDDEAREKRALARHVVATLGCSNYSARFIDLFALLLLNKIYI